MSNDNYERLCAIDEVIFTHEALDALAFLLRATRDEEVVTLRHLGELLSRVLESQAASIKILKKAIA